MKHLDSKEKVVYVLIILILFLALSGFLVERTAVFAQLDALSQTADVAGLGSETQPTAIVGRIIGIVLGLMGIILVVLMLAGGIMWMTSGGSAEQVIKAKKLMTSALIGLIIVVFSYSISRFVVERFSQVTEEAPVEPPE